MRFFLRIFAWPVVLVTALGLAGCESASRLPFRHDSYVVPEGEVWRLSWKSPYRDDEICPAYDVRIERGAVAVGAERQAWVAVAEAGAALNISAVNKEVVIWLDAGTQFTTANDLLDIQRIVLRAPAHD